MLTYVHNKTWFPLQQIETSTKPTNNHNSALWSSISMDIFKKKSTLKSHGLLWKKVQKDRKTLKARGSEFAMRLYLLVI